jgi:membrane protease YdiL (CAAX protease family)
VLGFALGALVSATGSIAGAVLAHVLINAVNLHHILAFDGGLDGGERGEAPPMRLVGSERRRVVTGDRAVR